MNIKKWTSIVLCILLLCSTGMVLKGEEISKPDCCITVPSDAVLFVGQKTGAHFVDFTEIEPQFSETSGENTAYYFSLTDDSTYNYRISGAEYVTYGGVFKKTPQFALSVEEEALRPEGITKTTVQRDTAALGGKNVADIYLNAPSTGHIRMQTGETKQIVALRNWEAVNNTTGNYFIEPTYHYEVIDENGQPSQVVSIAENGQMTAENAGTAIVLVTYDAMYLDFSEEPSFYSAIWPENTGVFVVTVGEESAFTANLPINSGKNDTTHKLSGDTLDREHDCIYFTEETGAYTFTPENADIRVFVANPSVDSKLTFSGFCAVENNADGSVTVPLKTGRNIVKLVKDGEAAYQVITAKRIDICINGGAPVSPGDTLAITFDKLYHPVGKLAGVYNMEACAVYTEVSGYPGCVIGGGSAQYDFANQTATQTVDSILKEKDVWGAIYYEADGTLTIPEAYPYDTFTLSGGAIYATGWGDPYGSHRSITYATGKDANFSADAHRAYLGRLPDITIPIHRTDASLSGITLEADAVKTEYFEGDTFDTENLAVWAEYTDGTVARVSQYTVEPMVLCADTEAVTIFYKGKTAELPVTVKKPKVVSIEVITPPHKVEYREGDTFCVDGMVVEATYENGTKKNISDYTYAPQRELASGDTAIEVQYRGSDAAPTLSPISIPIRVLPHSPGSTNTITVYFTLLGDTAHGSGTGVVHTHRAGNLETWIPKTRISVARGSYVIDVVRKALALHGIPYTEGENYIAEVKNLRGMDNGACSGWMYMLNGRYPSRGVSEQTVTNGNSIVLHYTDDYTRERTDFGDGGGAALEEEKEEPKKEEPKEEPKEEEMKPPAFLDVPKDAWYYKAVSYMQEKGWMQGTEEGFLPEKNMTRAELCAVLYRMEQRPAVGKEIPFTDVKENAWYADAARWGKDAKIFSGYENGTFGGNDGITREQMVTILCRYGGETEDAADRDALSAFLDAKEIAPYAKAAFLWAVDTGLIEGDTEKRLCPKETASRAEVATILMRFCVMRANIGA